jgi:DNA-binding NarL/FixJ family response regulator
MRIAPRIRVLIAHSDRLMAAGIAATLAPVAEFTVTERAGSGDQLLVAASDGEAIDVTVSDYETGVNLVEASQGRRRVLVLTRLDGEAEIRRALEAGVRGYLLIGCDTKQLLDALRVVSAGGRAFSPDVSDRIAEILTTETLTRREQEVLACLVAGSSDKAIASYLGLSAATVKTHVKHILVKLNAGSRTEATAIALSRGMVAKPPRREVPAGLPRCPVAYRTSEPATR